MAEGREAGQAKVDRPKLTQGSWIRPGSVVLERSLADVLGVHAGDRITLDGRAFHVAGIAVTAASEPYPGAGAAIGGDPFPGSGLLWLTGADARSLATPALPLSYVLTLKLADPAKAPAFAAAHGSGPLYLRSWQDLLGQDAKALAVVQVALLLGSWLLGLLAVASVAVLVGGRMADQARRVGLLKAVGGTPGLAAAVLLAEYLALALAAAALGLMTGWLAAPLLTSPGAGLLGTAGTPSLTLATAGLVVTAAGTGRR